LIALRTGAPERAYRPDVDGMRALAVLSVVLYHAGVPHLSGGFTGVDIFFVISGYLIGGHIYAELRAGTFSFLRFYQRRVRRILPAFYAVLAFILIAALLLLSPSQTGLLGREACAAVLSGSNILYWGTTNYFTGRGNADPLLMTWSLGVEEQFYAVIPVLMVLLARFRRGLILPAICAICLLSFAFAWIELGIRPMMAFYLLPARAWEIGIGVALALVELNRRRNALPVWLGEAAGAVGLLLMLAPMALLTAETPFPGPAALPSVLGAALTIAAPGSLINTRLLSLAPLTFIGRISYSWYLWHWPLLALAHTLYGGAPPPGATVIAIVSSFGAAVLSYCLIERPFRRPVCGPAQLLMRYGLVSVAMLAAAAALWWSRGVPQRLPQLARMESTAQALQADACLDGLAGDQPDLATGCYPVPSTGVSVALWGDSHAAALAPELRAVAAGQGYGFAEIDKASCPPLVGATHYVPRIPLLGAGCERFNNHVMAQIESDRRIQIVILTSAWAGLFYRTWADGWLTGNPAQARQAPAPDEVNRLFVAALTATIERLQAAGKQVIVIGDTPFFAVDPLWRVESQSIPARRSVAAWLRVPDAADTGFAAPVTDPNVALATSLVEESVAGVRDVQLVNLKSTLCPEPVRCAYRDGDTLLYVDSNHLSAAGARYALRGFRLPAVNGSTPSELRTQ